MNRALALALTMDESEAAMILTFADEPELLPERCEELDPYNLAHDADFVTAARIVSDWTGAACDRPVFH